MRSLAPLGMTMRKIAHRTSAVAPSIFFHGSARPPRCLAKKFFNPTVEIEIVLRPREAVPFVGINHVGHFALRFAQAATIASEFAIVTRGSFWPWPMRSGARILST